MVGDSIWLRCLLYSRRTFYVVLIGVVVVSYVWTVLIPLSAVAEVLSVVQSVVNLCTRLSFFCG